MPALFVAPAYTVAAYLAVGAVVALTRWLAPNRTVDASTMTVDAPAFEVSAEPVAKEEIALAA